MDDLQLIEETWQGYHFKNCRMTQEGKWKGRPESCVILYSFDLRLHIHVPPSVSIR